MRSGCKQGELNEAIQLCNVAMLREQLLELAVVVVCGLAATLIQIAAINLIVLIIGGACRLRLKNFLAPKGLNAPVLSASQRGQLYVPRRRTLVPLCYGLLLSYEGSHACISFRIRPDKGCRQSAGSLVALLGRANGKDLG